MPRLDPALFRRAAGISPHLATLLPACRTIDSARMELRWIREHVLASFQPSPSSSSAPLSSYPRFHTRPQQHNGAYTSLETRNRHQHRHRRRNSITTTKTGKITEGAEEARTTAIETAIAHLVARRGAGEPLQYVLGSQPFAGLEILCARGVLIPRPETEAWVVALGELLFAPRPRRSVKRDEGSGREEEGTQEEEGTDDSRTWRILDLCSGTGCIGLSLYARVMKEAAAKARGSGASGKGTTGRSGDGDGNGRLAACVLGLDYAPRAVRLARKNLRHNFDIGHNQQRHQTKPRLSSSLSAEETNQTKKKDLKERQEEEQDNSPVTFHHANIFQNTWLTSLLPHHLPPDSKKNRPRQIDILVSNPPYISPHGFATSTDRSVRNHEPRLALVPPSPSPFPLLFTKEQTEPNLIEEQQQQPQGVREEDIFYARLLHIAHQLRPLVAVFEVGDMEQAIRVVEMAVARRHRRIFEQNKKREEVVEEDGFRWDVVEIWRDEPDARSGDDEVDSVVLEGGRRVLVRGRGHGRVVFFAEGEVMRNRGFVDGGFRGEAYGE